MRMQSPRQRMALIEKLQNHVLTHRPAPNSGPYLKVFLNEGFNRAFPDYPSDPESLKAAMTSMVEYYQVSVEPFTLHNHDGFGRHTIECWQYVYDGVLLGIVPK